MLIVPALPNMWALKHAMYHDFPTPKEKYRWMMACVFIPCLGGIAYYLVGRKHASKEKVDIRARLEAERARAEAEKAAKAAALSEAAVSPESAAGEAAEPGTVSEAAAVRENVPEDAVKKSSADAGPAPSRDEWSFGCPDDARR